jgi:hypothetical protein
MFVVNASGHDQQSPLEHARRSGVADKLLRSAGGRVSETTVNRL